MEWTWSCHHAARGVNCLPSIKHTTVSWLLDTNVVSELLRPSLHPAVEAWVEERSAIDLYFSAVGEAELRYGVATLPMGRRRDALALVVEAILREDFNGRILSFDRAAACQYADIAAMHRAIGRPIAPIDCQIAAIARSQEMAVVTRNIRDFEGMDVEVIDPWTAT